MKKILCFGIAICLAVCFVLPASAAGTDISLEGYTCIFETFDYEANRYMRFYVESSVLQEYPQIFLSLDGQNLVLLQSLEIVIDYPELTYSMVISSVLVPSSIDNQYIDGDLAILISGFEPQNYISVPNPCDLSSALAFYNSYVTIENLEGNTGNITPIPGNSQPETPNNGVMGEIGAAFTGVVGWVGQVFPLIREYPGFIMMIVVPLCVGILTWVTTIYKRRRG